MNQIKRSLPGVLLALALLVPCATAAQAEPPAGTPDRWLTSIVDLLGGFFDGLWSVGAASETESDPQVVGLDGGDAETAPRAVSSWDPNGATTDPETAPSAVSSWDPNG